MKKHVIYVIALVLVVLGVMNIAIWQKETILSDGERIYLKLAPRDPRSFMQGDYMRLRYAVDNAMQTAINNHYNAKFAQQRKGVIVGIDERGIGTFVRLDVGQSMPLAANEKRFRISGTYRPRIKPNSFFFQEGHGKHYESAEYGIFTFAKDSHESYILSGLADKNLQKITPPTP